MGVLADKEIRRLAVGGWLDPNPADNGASAIQRHMIEPFAEGERRPGVISYGLSSYGYDMRIGDEFEVFTNPHHESVQFESNALDPKAFDRTMARRVTIPIDATFRLPAYSFALGVSVERFRIPRDIMTVCLGKSTYARCGLYVNITPLEPEWEGYPTIELTNPTPRPIVVYPGEGIAQLLFFRAETDLREIADRIAEAALSRPIDWVPQPNLKLMEPGEVQEPFTVEQWKRQIPLDGCRITCETSYADKGGKYQGQEAHVVHPRVDSEKETL